MRSDSARTPFADLAGKRLAMVPGTTTEKALSGALKQRQLRADAVMVTSGEIEAVFSRWLAPLGQPSVLLSALYYLQGIPV